MMQQVNLFQPQLRRLKKPLRAAVMLQCLGLAALALAAAYAWQRTRVAAVEAELAGVVAEEQAAQQRLAETQAQYPPRARSKLLEEDLARLQKQLEEHRRLAAALENRTFGNTSGFSAYFEGLSRQHVQGTWLSRIDIRAGGFEIALDGHALLPEMVPLYVQRLGGEAAFAGKSFGELTLERPQDDPLRVDFAISAGGMAAQASPRKPSKAGGNG